MTTNALIKAAKTPTGHLLLGLFARELVQVGGYIGMKILKAAIKGGILAKHGVKSVAAEARHEVATMVAEVAEEVKEIERSKQPEASAKKK